MGSYENFARVYDEFMDQTPYDLWCDHILKIFLVIMFRKTEAFWSLDAGPGR